MADKIRLLPEVVANQIAAGEVVNRPASVVKEMMENAIDAGATSVKVNFRDGGKDLIQIVDDGCGMSPIDARMAFDRHATSKIGAVEDIYALHTFGFRGEALASIAAVSQVELRTRQAGDEVGTQTEINGGQFAAQNPVMCPVGSQFFVRNLFYNVPARRRFLDKSTTSASQIKAEFQRIALCNPQIAFELYANDAPVYTGRWRDASSTWWGVTSSRTCWRSRPTLRSPASRDISAVRLPPRNATRSNTFLSTGAFSRAPI